MKKQNQLPKAIFILLVILIVVARYAPSPNGTSIHNHSNKPDVLPNIQLNPSSITTEAEMEKILNHLNRDIPSKTTKTIKTNSSNAELDNYNKMIDKINANSEAEFKKFKQSTTDALNSWKEMDYSIDN